MFSFFHKKKHSPGESPEDTSQPPIPGPEDGFIIINQGKNDPPANGGSLYPSINPDNQPPGYPPSGYPQPTMPQQQKKEVGFLQGVPFNLSKELSSDSSRDMMAMQLSELMAFMSRKIQFERNDYDFSVEKSVVMEN